MTLIAVVSSLDSQIDRGVVEKVAGVLQQKGEQAARVLRALVASRSTRLFSTLYERTEVADLLVEALLRAKDGETLEAFRQLL